MKIRFFHPFMKPHYYKCLHIRNKTFLPGTEVVRLDRSTREDRIIVLFSYHHRKKGSHLLREMTHVITSKAFQRGKNARGEKGIQASALLGQFQVSSSCLSPLLVINRSSKKCIPVNINSSYVANTSIESELEHVQKHSYSGYDISPLFNTAPERCHSFSLLF